MYKSVSNSRKILSMIVPIFNNANTIADCLNSIINSFHNCLEVVEIILVNDGSTDDLHDKIKEFLNYPFISIINQKNSGVSVARNTGLDNAHGKYIWFIDADDSINNFDGKTCLYNLCSQNADLYLFGFKKYSYLNNGNCNCKIVSNKFKHNYTKEEFSKKFTKIFTKNEFNVPWNKIYKLNIIKKYNIKYICGMKSGEDAAFNCDYMIYCDSFYVSNKILYNYVILRKNKADYYGDYYKDLQIMLVKMKNMANVVDIPDTFLNNKYLEARKGIIDNLYLKLSNNKVSWTKFHSELLKYEDKNKINFFKLSGYNKLKYILCVNPLSIYFTYLIKSK